MRITPAVLGTLGVAAALIVAGGVVSKYLDPAAGASLSGLGGLIVGWLSKQPGFAVRDEGSR